MNTYTFVCEHNTGAITYSIVAESEQQALMTLDAMDPNAAASVVDEQETPEEDLRPEHFAIRIAEEYAPDILNAKWWSEGLAKQLGRCNIHNHEAVLRVINGVVYDPLLTGRISLVDRFNLARDVYIKWLEVNKVKYDK